MPPMSSNLAIKIEQKKRRTLFSLLSRRHRQMPLSKLTVHSHAFIEYLSTPYRGADTRQA